MKALGAGEFKKHFSSDGHWYRDMRYRVHMGLPVYNRLLEPMELSASQIADFKSRDFVDLAKGFPFPEDLLPKHFQVGSKVLFMTLISGICEWLRSGGDFALLRRLWANFRASLGESAPEYEMSWSRTETVASVVSHFLCFRCRFFLFRVEGSFVSFSLLTGMIVFSLLFVSGDNLSSAGSKSITTCVECCGFE